MEAWEPLADQPAVVVDGRKEFHTCGGTLTPVGKNHGAFEERPLWGRWYLHVPYRHLTYGWPVLWGIRLRKYPVD